MRFLHLGDLHIGKRVHERSMADEQRHVFAQIIELARDRRVDAVLIAGDVFDRATPSREALELAEELLAGFIALQIPVFMIPGNHDSAQQVSYCSSITAAVGLHVEKAYSGHFTRFRMADEYGPVDIHLLPFVRPMDVRLAHPDRADEISTHNDAVRVALEEHPFAPAVRNVLVAHQFVVNGVDSPLTCDSETISVGGIDSVQASLFDTFDYVALGHIHSRQQVRRSEVRYCGAPLAYSFSEAGQIKTATIVELGPKQDGAPCTVSFEEYPLMPIHAMREVTASYEELAAGIDTGDHDDYMHVTLTDRALYDALGRVRSLYPNLLHLDWAETFVGGTASTMTLEQMKQKSPQELLEDFYAAQSGMDFTPDESAAVDAILAAREGGAR